MVENILAVAVGGGIGAALRYIVTLVAAEHGGMVFPYGTIIVNCVGSLCIGLLMMFFQSHSSLSPLIKLLLITGALGGFTTFSTFNMELLTMVREGAWSHALWYGGGNIIGAFLCCLIGVMIGERLW